MDHGGYTSKEIAERGQQIYEHRLKQQLEPENVGKYLVIDILTGAYEMDIDGEAASIRARDKYPNGIRYGMRIEYRAWGRMGRSLRSCGD